MPIPQVFACCDKESCGSAGGIDNIVRPRRDHFDHEADNWRGVRNCRSVPRLRSCQHVFVDMIDGVPMEDRDTKGDLYEYMLGKIASAGQNGQFRTPRHIIQLMVELVPPVPTDIMCDPASGTCGFPVAVGEYLRAASPGNPPRRQAQGALPPPPLPRIRLRQHHAPHRQHEHAPARRGKPRHPLPRLPRAGPRGRRGKIYPPPRQSALCRLARLRDLRQGSPRRS